MSNGTYDLTWQSSPEERYDTDMNLKAGLALMDAGYETAGGYGGTDLVTGVSDNCIVVLGPLSTSAQAAAIVQRVVGHHVKIVPDEDD
jgi:hypothetical protein